MVQWVRDQLWDKGVLLAYVLPHGTMFTGYNADGFFICSGQFRSEVKTLVARHMFSNPEEE